VQHHSEWLQCESLWHFIMIIIISHMHLTLYFENKNNNTPVYYCGLGGLLFVLQTCLDILYTHNNIYIYIIIIISASVFDEEKHWTVTFRILRMTMITIILRRLDVYKRRKPVSKRQRRSWLCRNPPKWRLEGLLQCVRASSTTAVGSLWGDDDDDGGESRPEAMATPSLWFAGARVHRQGHCCHRRRRVIDYFRHHRLLPHDRVWRPEEVAASALVLAAYEDISGLQYTRWSGGVGCTCAAELSIYIGSYIDDDGVNKKTKLVVVVPGVDSQFWLLPFSLALIIIISSLRACARKSFFFLLTPRSPIGSPLYYVHRYIRYRVVDEMHTHIHLNTHTHSRIIEPPLVAAVAPILSPPPRND